MNIKRLAAISLTCAVSLAVLNSCIKYSFSGATIPADARTVSIPFFPNNAALVSPILSTTFTEALQDRFQRQTKLSLVRENGDLAFEGEITGYQSQMSSVTSNTGDGTAGAAMNRLVITVRARFTNSFQPEYNYDRSFSQYAEYPSTEMLQNVEGTLIPEIVDMLVEDIFNAAVAQW